MIEVRQEDRVAQQTFYALSEAGMGSKDLMLLERAFATHRQQAEDAMRERCAKVCHVQADLYRSKMERDAGKQSELDFEIYEQRQHSIEALEYVETAIRGIDAGGEGER